jgi:hypothetical protein
MAMTMMVLSTAIATAGGMFMVTAILFSVHLVHSRQYSSQTLSLTSLPPALSLAFITITPVMSLMHPSTHYHYRTCIQLCASPFNNLMQTDVIERLELTKQFERWRFMQKMIEGEIHPSDIEDVLLLVLHAYLQHGPTGFTTNNKNENGGIASPVLTPDQRCAVQDVIDSMISISDGIGDSRILHMLVLPPADWDSISIDGGDMTSKEDNMVEVDGNALSILKKIELVLPDPIEDEESHKSAWDVIVELHGRESVRVEEEKLKSANLVEASGGSSVCVKYRAQSLQWRTLSTVGRVLIHFDFLTKGVLKEGTFTVD